MSSASLSLLKGAKKDALGKELTKPDKATEPPAEEVVVDIDSFTSEQLDALVEENEIETPDGWSGFDAQAKKAWLKETFEEAPAATGVEAPASEETKEVEASGDTADPAAHDAQTDQAAAKPPAKAKKAGKSKAVAPSNAKTGEVMEPDVLSDLIHEIENMKEKDAREIIVSLSEQTEVTMFKLGGVLSVIQANSWFEPYASFREFVEKEHGMHYRKAMYWVGIYNALAAAKVTWTKVKGLGWTKLKELAQVITEENQDQWIEIAQNSNTLTLIETVKKHLAKDAPKAIEDQTTKTVTTKTFKVHDDQKATIDAAIAKAKDQSSTTVDTVALEYICIDFLAGHTLEQKLKSLGIEAALEIVGKAFPDANINVELNIEEDTAA